MKQTKQKSFPAFLVDIQVKQQPDFDLRSFLEIINDVFDNQLKQHHLEELSQYAGTVPLCKVIALPYEIAVEKMRLIDQTCNMNGIRPFEFALTQREWK